MTDPMEGRRCTARARSGDRCRRLAAPGATVCAMHGGRAPQVVAAAQRRMEAAAAAQAVTTFGLPRELEPHQALLEELHRTAGHVEWLAAKIASFDTDDALHQRDPTGRLERPSVLVELYQAERSHLVRVSKACIDAGVAEREVRLAEEQGRQLASVLQGVLGDVFVALKAAGLPIEILVLIQRQEVPAIIRRRLLPLSREGDEDESSPAQTGVIHGVGHVSALPWGLD